MSTPVLKHPRKPQPAVQGEGVILGVDTHKDVHVAAILTVAGVLLATHSFATTREGYMAVLVWAHRFGDVNAA
jgi:transposase